MQCLACILWPDRQGLALTPTHHRHEQKPDLRVVSKHLEDLVFLIPMQLFKVRSLLVTPHVAEGFEGMDVLDEIGNDLSPVRVVPHDTQLSKCSPKIPERHKGRTSSSLYSCISDRRRDLLLLFALRRQSTKSCTSFTSANSPISRSSATTRL